MCVGRPAEGMSVVSDSEVLVLFVTVDREDFSRKFSERQNLV
jgi:hypothetical protein